MNTLRLLTGAWACLCAFTPINAQEGCDGEFTEDFMFDQCVFADNADAFAQPNPYFLLDPGWWIVLEGEEEDDEGEIEAIRVEITVLNETKMVAGVRTRVVEEREWIDGELYEVSRNFYAICTTTNDVIYFGEEVDFYEDGELVSHEGEWLAGENGAQPGVIMPGSILIGSRYMQEIAEDDEALDRGEILDIIETQMAGETFENVVVIADSSALEPDDEPELKMFAPGVGQIQDEELELVEYGWQFRSPNRWMPHVTRFDGGFETELRFVNDAESDATVTLYPYLSDGSAMATMDVTVTAESTLAMDSRSLFGESEVSHFGITGSNDCIVVSSYKAIEGTAASAEVRESGSLTCGFKVFQGESSVIFDGVALVNLGTVPAEITVTQTAQDGTEITEEDLAEELAANAKMRVVFDDILEDQPGSLIEVESSQPFAVVSLRGTAPGSPVGVLWANTPFESDDCNEDFHVAPSSLMFEELKLLIEHNAADEDTGFQCFADGDPWVDLEIQGPGGEIFSSSAEGTFIDFGVTELFFETSEPENAEVPIADVLARLPEGTYTATATMVDGTTSSVSTQFTHTIPAATEILTPEDGAENVDPAEVMVSWSPVTTTMTGATDITIAGYQIIVEAEEEPSNPEGFFAAEFNAYVPASITSITVPAEFIQTGKLYEIEVLVIEESGNQTISSSEFFTTDAFEVEDPDEPEGLKDGKVLIEHNSTDEDTGFQGFGDGDPWNEMEIEGPNGVFVDFSAEGSLVDFGLTEIFFETSEPENDVVPIADVLARLPEGEYAFTGDIVDGDESEFTTMLTHTIPEGPELISPADGDEEVDPEETVVSWNPVTESLDGSEVTIVGYQVIVESDEDPAYPLSFAHPTLFLYVPATVTSVSIPSEFMQADTDYEYEVLAIEASGNQTLTSAEFATEEP